MEARHPNSRASAQAGNGVGQRRAIEVPLSPLAKRVDGAGRER